MSVCTLLARALLGCITIWYWFSPLLLPLRLSLPSIIIDRVLLPTADDKVRYQSTSDGLAVAGRG